MFPSLSPCRVFPSLSPPGTTIGEYKRRRSPLIQHTPHLKPLSLSTLVTCTSYVSGVRFVIFVSESKSSSVSLSNLGSRYGFAFYLSVLCYLNRDCHGYLAILIVCYTMSYALLSYITLFSLVLSLNIGLAYYLGLALV